MVGIGEEEEEGGASENTSVEAKKEMDMMLDVEVLLSYLLS